MNAIKLIPQENNIILRQNLFVCGNCETIYMDEKICEKCCKCYVCGIEKGDKTRGINYVCACCSDERREKIEKERIEKAEKLENYDGWVFCEDLSKEYFNSVEDFLETWWDENDVSPPEYVFACESEGFKLSYDNILENKLDDFYEDAWDDLRGKDELELAIKQFNEKNKDLKSYYPNFRKVVKVPEEMSSHIKSRSLQT